VVAVAASAGGVEALSAFVSALPADFPAAVLIILHIPPTGTSVLPRILSRAGKLPARHPRDGEALMAGTVLVAPPDRHLAVADHRVLVLTGPRENGHRPSADVLLRSVAEAYGPRSAGVILSGTMDDGAAGLRAVRTVGGMALVQDPKQAAFPSMPEAAIEEADPQVIASPAALAEHLCGWLDQLPQRSEPAMAEAGVPIQSETNIADPAPPAPMTCPECGGTLWVRDDYGAERFRCRVGHTFSADGLLAGKRTVLERALWAAVVALEERVDLSRRIAKRLKGSGRAHTLDRYLDDAAVSEQRAGFLRQVIHDLVNETSPVYDDDHASS
jgi:two-component system, chemotaxis family, protein-glutamate methylesterase/glutaminase